MARHPAPPQARAIRAAPAAAAEPVAAWILKTEPAECSLDDIRQSPGGVLRWDGIRNFQARNHLRLMRAGDRCLVYHSGVREPAIAGEATVVAEAYPDPAQFDPASPWHDPRATPSNPRWFAIDLRYLRHFPEPLPLAAIRAEASLADLPLLRQGRLSVSPVMPRQLRALEALLGKEAGCVPR
jgi:predicted RNA-binding protein with PUA-like domain